jgi:nitroreductase
MEVFEAIQKRRSVRAYDQKPVPPETVAKILEAGRIAPSANNRQPWHFIVVTDQSKREVLSEGRYAKFLKDTPVVIVGCGDRVTSPKWHVVDTAIALQQMVIAATAEGLATCWIGSFSEDSVRALLKIPEEFTVVAMLALGYPREKTDLKAKLLGLHNRKPLESIVSYEEFGEPKV